MGHSHRRQSTLASNSFPIVEDGFAVSATMAKQPLHAVGQIANAVDAASSQLNATRWNVMRRITLRRATRPQIGLDGGFL